jgi:hypothetical protein
MVNLKKILNLNVFLFLLCMQITSANYDSAKGKLRHAILPITATKVTDRMLSQLDQETADSLANWATYIIVGAGAAGSVVAARLAENPENNVLVIELGPDNF